MTYKLEMLDITKKFGDFVANDKITIKLKSGEIHAILGENGAGKTTLMNCLFGIYSLDGGVIKVDGKVVDIKNPSVARDYKIGMVHQHFKLVPIFTIAENIILGREDNKGPFLTLSKAKKRIKELSDYYGFGLDPNKKVRDLTVGEQQKVEILKMLYQDADILIFDEPTGALIPQEIEELLKIIKKLKNDGKAIIIITHKLNEIKEIGDFCSVIRHGKYIDSVRVSESTEAMLAELMVGKKVSFKVKKEKYNPGKPILEIDNINVKGFGDDAVKNATFKVHSGEIVGIAGVDGNGQTELVEAITGLKNIKSGTIKLNNQNITKKSIRQKTESGIGHIPQDRQKYGLVLDYTIGENAGLQEYYKKPYSSGLILHRRAFKEEGEKLIKKYDIRSGDGVNSLTKGLSGGNQQKVIVGREIERDPDLLIATQPTRGLDVGAIEYIHQKIIEQRDNGKGILLVSLELDEILKLSDRVIVMHDGKIMGDIINKPENIDNIAQMMAGHDEKEVA